MEDGLRIEVESRGELTAFEVRLATTGYTHNFLVIINAIEVVYEPDEERNYRAIVSAEAAQNLNDKDRELIQLVCEKLDSLKGL